jgi:hypothetical protein
VSRIAFTLSAAFALALTGPALGKDVCLSVGGATTVAWVLQSIHVPRPGKTAALSGVYVQVGDGNDRLRAPLSGTIYNDGSQGKLAIGLFMHSMRAGAGNNNFTMTWQADPHTLEGTAGIDTDGDFIVDAHDGTLELTAVSCKAIDFQ